jgi:virginiamycin B lyase
MPPPPQGGEAADRRLPNDDAKNTTGEKPALRLGEGVMIRLIAAGFAALAGCTVAVADTVHYFPVTAGAHPHDVAAAPDGTVWYTAQHHGALGILDPKTGKVEQVALGKGASPHGVIAGPDGAAWITESGLNAIARVEPKSRDVKLFPLPKGFERANLNTATFDKQGTLWFTGQSGVYGRLDPVSGKLDAWKAPKGSGPYGITTTPSGEVWYASLAGDHIARVDTATGAATVVDPPKPGVGPRRVWSDSKGVLWVSFWHSGEIGRYDPAQKMWKVFALPKSKSGCYSVYVDEKDKVWVTDFVANAILRFDPATEKFDTFHSNKRGAAVRQMLGRAGEVWGAESGTDRLVVVRY